ncbi:MAG: hypothetical protein K9I94_01595 [Bacteroidales bacterium]|nr:hypothetical protein [Bacteroidales bacterium]
MKRAKLWVALLMLPVFLVITSCDDQGEESKQAEKQEQVKSTVDEFDELLTYIEETGDFINSPKVPSMIASSEVHKNLDANIHIIDIRKSKDYTAGHIKGAVNVGMNKLIDYFENEINPNSYSHIVMVCYSGQSAGFATSILRLLGYDNVYDMKWGMSSWDRKTAEKKWLKKISNKYADQLETKAIEKASPTSYPKLNTGKEMGMEILRERAQELLSKGFKPFTVKADELFQNGDNYYIVNYWPKAKYEKGHIPGAIQYDPKKSLGRSTYLNTLPIDETVVPYCFTGQHSAFVTAYLNMIGYDAKSLVYGANSFMNGLMRERGAKKWHAFSPKKIHDYEVSTSTAVKKEGAEKQAETIEVAGGC